MIKEKKIIIKYGITILFMIILLSISSFADTVSDESEGKSKGISLEGAGMKRYDDYSWMPDDSGKGSKQTVIAGTNGGGNGQGGGASGKKAQKIGRNNSGEKGSIATNSNALNKLRNDIKSSNEKKEIDDNKNESAEKKDIKETVKSEKETIETISENAFANFINSLINSVMPTKEIVESETIKVETSVTSTVETVIVEPVVKEIEEINIVPTSAKKVITATEEFTMPTSKETVKMETEEYTNPTGKEIEDVVELKSIDELPQDDDFNTIEESSESIEEFIESSKIVDETNKPDEGLDLIEESYGDAREKGKYQIENTGEYAGKKVLQFLERNGNIGLNEESLTPPNYRGIIITILSILFALGVIVFISETVDKKDRHDFF